MKKIILALFLVLCSNIYSQCYSEIGSKVFHNLSIKPDGTLWAWGQNDYYQLGDNTNIDRNTPIQIGTANNWSSVYVGTYYSLAIKNNGTLWAWGSNSDGQTGNGGPHTPQMVGTDSDWVTAAAGLQFSAAIKSNGTLWMWGYNNYGQLGNGTTISSGILTQVGTETNWVAVSLGAQHTIALKSDGTLWAWGLNSYGNLGINNLSDQHTPVQVGTSSDWAKICAGYSTSYAIKANGTLWAWGSNTFGGVGNGSSLKQKVPLQLGTSTWKSISATCHCLAIKTNGTLWSWGRNESGEVGNGNPGVNQSTPIQIGTDNDWIKAATGFYHSIALKGNGTLWSWGENEFGTLGNGTFTDNLVPSQVASICNQPLCTITQPTLANITAQCSVTSADVTVPSVTDSCGNTITATLQVGTFPITTQGTTTIVWRFANSSGAVTASQNIIIDDTVSPVPGIANLPVITRQCNISGITPPTATDNCVGIITATTTDPLSYNQQGSYTITWSYNDGNGNISTQTQSVIIDDTISPVANVSSLPAIIGQCSISGITPPTATDDCAGVITATTTDPLSYNQEGSYTINWSYNDGNGNVSTQTQAVIIDDTVSPLANLANLPAITGECSVFAITPPTATDNCVGVITAITTDPLNYNQQGSYTITWSYNDGNGNVSTQTQAVIIDDTISPVANVSNLPAVTGQCSILDITPPTATDDCTGLITATTTDPLNYNQQGSYTITWSYNDGNGNVSTQTQSIIIDDTTSPQVSTLDITLDLAGANSVDLTVEQVDNGSDDNCSDISLNIDTNVFTTVGTYEVTLTATDASGNTASDTATVTVIDSVMGNNNFQDGDIILFPVPAKEMLYIRKEANVIIVSTEIYDMLGRRVYNENGNIDNINMASLSSAGYYLVLTTSDAIIRKTFTVQK